MSSYVNNFTATLWCKRFVQQLTDANEGWVRTTARLLQKEHVVMVSTVDGIVVAVVFSWRARKPLF